MNNPDFVYDDGGRESAGYKGTTSDCVVRAIAIAAQMDYKTVYQALYSLSGESPRNGVNKKFYKPYIESLGFEWVSVMGIGTGCRMRLAAGEIPEGRLIVRLSRHLTAVIDKSVHDTYDPSRNGTRCVYGYWKKGEMNDS